LISISRNLAAFDELSWKVITQKCLFHISAPVPSWAPASSRIVDPASQDFSWGSGKRHAGDVACPSEKSATVISVEGLNGKALKEAGRWNTVTNRVSDGSAAHGSSAAIMEMIKKIK
jgi:hypothetical protein